MRFFSDILHQYKGEEWHCSIFLAVSTSLRKKAFQSSAQSHEFEYLVGGFLTKVSQMSQMPSFWSSRKAIMQAIVKRLTFSVA
jgi:hypothetical protein